MNPETMECPICNEEESNHTTPCGHRFCKKCIGKWNDKSLTCPMCRSPLRPSLMLEEITLRNKYYPTWVGTGKVIKEGKSSADIPFYQVEIHTYSTLEVKYKHFFFMNQWEVIS